MINRDLIRTKITQLTYAYYVNGNEDMNNAEKELFFSMSKAYDLYLFLLNLIVAVRDEAESQWNVNSTRLLREGEKTASRNFLDNKFVQQLKINEQLCESSEHKNISWNEDIDVVRQILSLIQESNQYNLYMLKESTTYEEDKDLWKYIFKHIICPNDALVDALEEKSLYWNDDKYIVDTFVAKTISRFNEEAGAKQPLLEEYRNDEDKSFALNLFRNTIDNGEEYRGYMAEVSKNWDLERLSTMDVILMQIAIAEMITFPEIAIHVTINEYIELAKMYSTPKSAGYINGMLDAIARLLNEKGLILKPVKK